MRVDDRGARYPVRVDPFVQQAELTAARTAAAEDDFGYSVAVSGNTAVVGAPHHDPSQTRTPTNRAPSTCSRWARRLGDRDPDRRADRLQTAGDELGYSVAISATRSPPAQPGGTERAGALHINRQCTPGHGRCVHHAAGGWTSTSTPNARLTASDRRTRWWRLGWSVAISGNTVVAGAPFDGDVIGDPRGSGVRVRGTRRRLVGSANPERGADRERPSAARIISAGRSGSRAARSSSARSLRGRRHEPGRGVCVHGTGRRLVGHPYPDRRADRQRPQRQRRARHVGRVSGNTVVAGAPNH